MMSNKHLSVESLYLYVDHVFGYENWSHKIKNQTSLFMILKKYLYQVIIFIDLRTLYAIFNCKLSPAKRAGDGQ